MVLSAKLRTVFRYSSDLGDFLGAVGFFAEFVAGLAEKAPELEGVGRSSNSMSLVGLHLAAIAGTAAERALLGIIPVGTHAIYRLLEGSCAMAVSAIPDLQSAATQCIDTLKRADVLVQSSYKIVTDTQNQARAFWWVVDTVLHRAPAN